MESFFIAMAFASWLSNSLYKMKWFHVKYDLMSRYNSMVRFYGTAVAVQIVPQTPHVSGKICFNKSKI